MQTHQFTLILETDSFSFSPYRSNSESRFDDAEVVDVSVVSVCLLYYGTHIHSDLWLSLKLVLHIIVIHNEATALLYKTNKNNSIISS